MFKSSADIAYAEIAKRELTPKKLMRFGIEFLDHALKGIYPDDLILLGAPSGVGKTQLCCNIAYANIEDGKTVHYIALEASEFEIERRLKFPLVLERYLADPNRPQLAKRITYSDWLAGDYVEQLREYELASAKFFESAFKNLYVYYKEQNFGVNELIQAVLQASAKTDLIIIDHVHYFDFDGDNENRAIKEIAKTVRTLAIEMQKPIILVAHLRKRERMNEELVAGLDEFHGSSDLYKIATRVVTFAPGGPDEAGNFKTFFRIPKNRIDGGVTRFLGQELFNPKRGFYESGSYKVGWCDLKRKEGFAEVGGPYYPAWARSNVGGGNGGSNRVNLPLKPRMVKNASGPQGV